MNGPPVNEPPVNEPPVNEPPASATEGPPAPNPKWVAGLLLAWLSVTWLASGLAMSSVMPSTVVMTIGLAFLPYGVLLWAVPSRSVPPAGKYGGTHTGGQSGASNPFPVSARTLMLITLMAGLPALFAPAVLSDDVFRYVWDGHVSGAFVDPYAYAPSSPALAHLRDDLWRHVNNPTVPTIYPPIAQGLFLAADAVAHHPISFKALALAMHLAIGWRLSTVPNVGARGAAAWWLNPLALFESALSGHVDVFAGAFVLLFVLALVSERPWRAALFAVGAAGVKLIGLLLLPLIATQRRVVVFVALPFALLCVAPLASAGYGDGELGGLSHYAGRWEGNAGPYRVIESAIRRGLEARYEVAPGQIEVQGMSGFLERVEGTLLDPWRSFAREKKPLGERWSMASHILSSWLARLSVLLSILIALLVSVRRRTPPLAAARNLLFMALLLSPQVHPWYLLWLLPLEACSGRKAGWVWSAAILVAYLPLDGWVSRREWVDPGLWTLLEYGLVILALGLEGRGYHAASTRKN